MDHALNYSPPNRVTPCRAIKRFFRIGIALIAILLPVSSVHAQSGNNSPLPAIPPRERAPDLSATARNVDRNPENLISKVIFKGNRFLEEYELSRNIGTREGRYFDPDQLQQDVDKLWRLPDIKRVNGPYVDKSPSGITVTFDIVERKQIRSLEFVGNREILDRTLKRESDLEINQPLDLHKIRMAKNRLEEFYREKGYPLTQIEILNVDDVENGEVTFVIHEDQKKRVWKVEFVGNKFVGDGRLKNFIESKPGILKVVGGVYNPQEIEQDIVRLEAYYKSFGFFNARIGRELKEGRSGRWLTIRYIIDEGPRYKIRDVSFLGNQAFTSQQLSQLVDLKPAEGDMPDFNVSKMNQDVVSLRDLYGSNGFVYSSVEAEPRFLEEPGVLDLVYRIEEGKQYRAGNINVHIQGDVSVTRREVALNRLSIKTGDLINSRELRNSERRLASTQIFAGANPGAGRAPPRIVVRPPELTEIERTANGGSSSAGSSSRSGGSSTRYR